MTKKHFIKVDPNDKDQRRDVANRMFAALRKDMARNKVLEKTRRDPEAPEPPKQRK